MSPESYFQVGVESSKKTTINNRSLVNITSSPENHQISGFIVDELRALRAEVDALKLCIVAGNTDTKTQTPNLQEVREGRIASVNKIGVIQSNDMHKSLDASVSAFCPSCAITPPPEEQQDEQQSKVVLQEEAQAAVWMPAYIRSLPALQDPSLPSVEETVTFTWDFLTTLFLGAVEHSPGLFHIPSARGSNILPSRTFYAMSLKTEPFMPRGPSEHGAKIMPFFNPEYPGDGNCDPYSCVPLFVSASTWGGKKRRDNEYIYYGMYTQTRWSDRVSSTEMEEHVSLEIKKYWAEELADIARPTWVTKALMKHFVKMPEYDGVMPMTRSNITDDEGAVSKRLKKDVKNFIEELQAWEQEARVQVGLMKPDDMLKSFDRAELDASPGLRFWWEYLECVGWDAGFYDMLVLQKKQYDRRR